MFHCEGSLGCLSCVLGKLRRSDVCEVKLKCGLPLDRATFELCVIGTIDCDVTSVNGSWAILVVDYLFEQRWTMSQNFVRDSWFFLATATTTTTAISPENRELADIGTRCSLAVRVSKCYFYLVFILFQ